MREARWVQAAVVMGLLAAAVVACGGGDDDPPPTTTPATAAPFTAKVIGFNDYHGNLESPGTFGQTAAVPAASRPAVGGADFIAAQVASLKKQNALNVVVGPAT